MELREKIREIVKEGGDPDAVICKIMAEVNKPPPLSPWWNSLERMRKGR